MSRAAPRTSPSGRSPRCGGRARRRSARLRSCSGVVAADPVEPITSAGHAQLGIAVLLGIAVIVVLITQFKAHAFLALTIGSLALGAFAGAPLDKAIASFTTGLGATVAGVGVLIALGAVLGKPLADSGGADEIVDTILARARGRAMPWAMVLIASVIGLRCSSRSGWCC